MKNIMSTELKISNLHPCIYLSCGKRSPELLFRAVIFAAALISFAFERVSLSETKFIEWQYLNESRKVIYKVCNSQFTAPLFYI